jgi:hypothetical protein
MFSAEFAFALIVCGTLVCAIVGTGQQECIVIFEKE